MRHFEKAPPSDDNANGAGGQPVAGIVGTPVIDNDLARMYFVTRSDDGTGLCSATSANPATLESADSHCIFTLRTVDVHDGADIAQTTIAAQVTASPPGSQPRTIDFQAMAGAHVQRPALLLAGGVVYVAFAATQFDAHCHEYHGWLLGYDADTLAPRSAFVTTPRSWGGGIWQSGNGPAADFLGQHLFLLSGNSNAVPLPKGPNPCSAFTASNPALSLPTSCANYQSPDCTGNGHPLDFEDSLIGLTVDPQTQLGFAAPTSFSPPDNFFDRNIGRDLDFGSGGPIMVPNSNLLVAGGKWHILYLFDRADVSRPLAQASTSPQDSSPFTSTGQHMHGSALWLDGSIPARPWVFVWSEDRSRGLTRYEVSGLPMPALTPDSASGPASPDPNENLSVDGSNSGAFLSISDGPPSPGSSVRNGIVWASICSAVTEPKTGQCTIAHLHAFDANDLARGPLWSFNAGAEHSWAKWVPPSIANDKVFLAGFDGGFKLGTVDPAGGGRVRVFGLRR